MDSTITSTDRGLIGFKSGLRVDVVEDDAVYVFSERGVTALQGPYMETLAPLLDGTRDLEGVVRAAPAELAPEQIAAMVSRLAAAGLLTVRSPSGAAAPTPASAYWEAAGLDPDTVPTGDASPALHLLSVGDIASDAALAALRQAGLTVAAQSVHTPGTYPDLAPGASLSVVLCPDYLASGLAEIDAAHRAARRPWLLAKPLGSQVWVGPVFDPRAQGACWHCLAHRLWGQRQGELHAQTALGRSGPASRPVVTVPALTATAMSTVGLEAAKWLAGYRGVEQRAVWTLDSLTLDARRHELHARPQCPSCGDPSLMREQARRPVVIAARAKAADTEGGHRARTPHEVLDDFGHLVSPVTGIVKEIRQDPRGPAEFNSFRSGPNIAAGRTDLVGLRAMLRAENGGKGTTPLHARVSALCEALERHSGFFHGDEERVRGSYTDLSDAAVHPDACQLFDRRQFADRDRWNAEHAAFQQVCDPFDDDAEMDWTPVWSLTEERHRLLPTAMLYFNAPEGTDRVTVRADSNGNAAGTSVEDAVVQGALELVERDAAAIWWYNRTRQPGVDLAAFGDPWLDRMRDVYADIGREFWVLDTTSDLGVPAMAAVSRRTGGPREDIMFGFGAHFDPRVALRRAVTEMNQLMPAVLDGTHRWDDPDAARWWNEARADGHPYLRPDPARRLLGPADYRRADRPDLADDVAALRDLLAERGLEMLVLDQTRPDVGLPVVKVVVPGLRGFWARFAPGRLFDVPLALGRVPFPTRYEDLNPYPLFL
ncbi:TOMM precursor leader peptide-binding protein [Nocardiopsis rhodophaea]|uniref:TOMM leader peptide-binding protein n=2 Tax=Nocardiopsis rhodophaea TaxID=280238 RepID=A0ABN2S6M5_9ACTN